MSTTPNIVPRGDQEGGLGTATKSWGKLFIENASDSTTAAATISNLAPAQQAVTIEASNTTGSVLNVNSATLTTGSLLSYTGTATPVDGANNTFSLMRGVFAGTGTSTFKGSILDVNKTGITASGKTATVYGMQIDIEDTATNVGTVDSYGLVVNNTFTSANGTTKSVGLYTNVSGADSNFDIYMENSADSSEYATMAVGAGGALTATTVSDDTTGHFEVAADGNITLDAAGSIALESSTDTTINTRNLLVENVDSSHGTHLQIQDTNNSADEKMSITFTKDKGAAGADNDVIFGIHAKADNAAQELTNFASINAAVATAADTDEAGVLQLKVAASDGTTSGLLNGLLAVGHGTNNDVDVTLGSGTTSLTTIAGDLDIDGDMITTAGNIELATGGSGNITLDGAGDIALEAAGRISLEAVGGDITGTTDNYTFSSGNSGKPLLTLKNTNTTRDQSGELQFLKDATDTADAEDLGKITFYGEDAGNNNTLFAQILGEILETDEGDEQGKLTMTIANNASMANALTASGNKVNASTVDVTIGAGEAATTTIYGNTSIWGRKGLTTVQDLGLTTFENTYASGEYNGEVFRYGSTDENLTVGGLYFLHTDGTWDLADADAVATGGSQLLGVGLGSTFEVGVLFKGLIRIPSTEILNTPGSGAVDGLPLYVSTTAGHFDFTAPSGSGDFVRIVGYAIDDHSGDVLVRFDPDKSWVELS